jgi:ribosomal protein L16/L10AE
MKIDQKVNKMHLSIVAVTLDKTGNRIRQEVFPDIPVTEKQPTKKNKRVQYKIFTKTAVRNQLIQFFDPDVMTRNTTTRRLPVWLVGSVFPDTKTRRHVLYMISNTVLGRSMYQNGNVTNVDTTHLDRLPLVSTNGIVEMYRYIITIGFEKASPQKQLQTRTALEIRPLLLQRAIGVDRIHNTYHGNTAFHFKIRRGLVRREPGSISKNQQKAKRQKMNLSIATTSKDPYPVPLTNTNKTHTNTNAPKSRLYVRIDPQTLSFYPGTGKKKIHVYYPENAKKDAVFETVTRSLGISDDRVVLQPYMTHTENRKTIQMSHGGRGKKQEVELLVIAPDPMPRIPVKQVSNGLYIPIDLEDTNLRPLHTNGRLNVFYNSKKQIQEIYYVVPFLNNKLGKNTKSMRYIPYTVSNNIHKMVRRPSRPGRGKVITEKLFVYKPSNSSTMRQDPREGYETVFEASPMGRIPVMRLDRVPLD